MKTKYHYAYLYPHGVTVSSETGRPYRHLYRFPSREERDEWVAAGNDVGRMMQDFRESVNRDQARADGLNASDRADFLATMTDVLWGTAAVGAGTAFVLWMVDRKQPEREQSVALVPAASTRGDAHLFLRGAF